MKEGFRTNLRQMRTRLGLNQQALADLAGVTRQTISGAETGQYVPSTAIALRLARILGCTVEELFWLEEAAPIVEAVPSAALRGHLQPTRVRLAQVGGRWVAHPLHGAPAFRTELVPADGVWAGHGTVRLLDEPEHLAQTALIAGCDPAVSLWARAAERWHPGLRIDWLWANSTEALGALRRGEVHAAGTHLFDPATGESNLPFVRRLLPELPVVLVNLGTWAEGLLLAPGNPKGITSLQDLRRPEIQIVNREAGSGARHLLDAALQGATAEDSASVAPQGVAPPKGAPVNGYDQVRYDHQGIAQAIAAGVADAGVSAAPVAAAWGLDFLPLQTVRYDLVIPKAYLTERPIQALLATLSNRWVRAQLEALGGFDTRQTGEIVGET
ncbi:MAG TPA: substrate-binding domain-containing protein [Symbiobacteriaceae bacterium]|nr:substrate-binding domain-containing protein [Symbiobacteriaceae bacterium]